MIRLRIIAVASRDAKETYMATNSALPGTADIELTVESSLLVGGVLQMHQICPLHFDVMYSLESSMPALTRIRLWAFQGVTPKQRLCSQSRAYSLAVGRLPVDMPSLVFDRVVAIERLTSSKTAKTGLPELTVTG